MNFTGLVKRLRESLERKMADEDITTTAVAEAAGVAQAHISNFLNGQRGISFDLADRLLKVAEADAEDLIAEQALCKRLPFEPMPIGDFITIPVISIEHALRPVLHRRHGESLVCLRKQVAASPRLASEREQWTRFVAINSSKETCLIIDRHEHSPGTGSFVALVEGHAEIGRLFATRKELIFCPDDANLEPRRAQNVIGKLLQSIVSE